MTKMKTQLQWMPMSMPKDAAEFDRAAHACMTAIAEARQPGALGREARIKRHVGAAGCRRADATYNVAIVGCSLCGERGHCGGASPAGACVPRTTRPSLPASGCTHGRSSRRQFDQMRPFWRAMYSCFIASFSSGVASGLTEAGVHGRGDTVHLVVGELRPLDEVERDVAVVHSCRRRRQGIDSCSPPLRNSPMMSLCSSRGKTRISMPVASAESRAKTGRPRNTSGHQSSPTTIIFAGPLGFAISALNAVTSAGAISVAA